MTTALSPLVVDSVRKLVQMLAAARFSDLEADGRAGRLTAEELRRAVQEYGRTLRELPEEAWALVDEYRQNNSDDFSLDVPLWTIEEGRSDLTLSISVRETREGVTLSIDDLHVL